MTDAERAREIAEDICAALIDGCQQMLDGQCELAACPCEDDTRAFETRIAAALAAVRSEATAAAEQRIADLTRERDEALAWIAEFKSGIGAPQDEPIDSVLESINEGAEDALQSEKAWKARAEAAERERDEANAAADMIATVREAWKARAEAALARLARARADALEDAARVAEAQPYYYDIQRQWVKDEIARKVRALIDSEPAGRADQEGSDGRE
jgi:hypothetical protein